MSLCFREAFLAKPDHEITEGEYFGHLIAHFREVRHSQDGGDVISPKLDPFGASIREMALGTDYEALQGEHSVSTDDDALNQLGYYRYGTL